MVGWRHVRKFAQERLDAWNKHDAQLPDVQLKACRVKLSNFLEELAKKESRVEYWQQQISGTLIAYPGGELEDLFKSFYEGLTEPTPRSKAITAYWILLILSKTDPCKENEEIQNLRLALNTPGRIIPNNHSDAITIDGNNVTLLAQSLIKITYLLFLTEHRADIWKFIQENKNEITANFAILQQFTAAWLKGQIKSIQKMSVSCSKFIVKNAAASSSVQIAHPHPFLSRISSNTLWGQFWDFYDRTPFQLAADGDQLYQSPVLDSSFYKRAFFWLLYWSYFPHAWKKFTPIGTNFIDTLRDIEEYLFADFTSLDAIDVTKRFIRQLFFTLCASCLLFIIAYGIFTLPLKILEVGMKYADLRLPFQDYLTYPKKLLHLSLVLFFSYQQLIFFPSLLILIRAPLSLARELPFDFAQNVYGYSKSYLYGFFGISYIGGLVICSLRFALSIALATARAAVIFSRAFVRAAVALSKAAVALSKASIKAATALYQYTTQYFTSRNESEQVPMSSPIVPRELPSENQPESTNRQVLIFSQPRAQRERRSEHIRRERSPMIGRLPGRIH